MNGLSLFKIGDISFLGDGAHTKVERVDNGVPYLSAQNIKFGNIDYSGSSFISESDYQRLFSSSKSSIRNLQKDDILFSIIGTIGNLYKYTNEDRFGVSSSVAIIRPRLDLVDPDYLYWILRSKLFADLINRKKGGSVQGYTNLPLLRETEIPIPDSIEKQSRLVYILNNIEDKINLNYKINSQLEAMAKLIYDYWFVQFDFPISEEQAIAMGKPEFKGKPYKASGGAMVYKEELKREVPEGWGVNNILQVSNLLGGGTPKTTERSYWGGDIPFYTPTDAEKTVFKITTAENISELGLKNSSTRLFSKGVIFITARGSVGNVIVAGCEMAMNQSCYALSPKRDIGSSFLYFATQALVSNFKVKSSGSIFKSIVSNDIKYSLLPIPPTKTIKYFGETNQPFFDKILVNLKENQQLVQLRDWLLPMLMNGQVRVGEDNKYDNKEELSIAAESKQAYS